MRTPLARLVIMAVDQQLDIDQQEKLLLLENLQRLRDERDLLKAEIAQLEAFQHECDIAADHLREIVYNSEDIGVYRLRTDLDNPNTGRVTYVNEACKRLLGVSFVNAFAEWFGNVHPEDREEIIKQQTMALQTGEYRTTLRLTHDNGETYHWIRQYAFAAPDEKGLRDVFNGFSWDATEEIEARHEAEQHSKRLRRMSYLLFQEVERQRRSIAGVLHDTIGQALSLVRFNLAREAKIAAGNSELPGCLPALDQIIDEIRTLTNGIYPTSLHQAGLVETLRWLCSLFNRTNDINIKFTTDSPRRALDDEVGILLYRAAGELLLNCVKHSDAKHVAVSLSEAENGLCLRVVDDGVGFQYDQDAPTQTGGLYLLSIRQQLIHLEGRLEIISAEGKGTDITVTIPI